MLENELKHRSYSRPCKACNGGMKRLPPSLVVIVVPCATCQGRGISELRCRECFTWKPVGEFDNGKRLVQRCSSCRAKVRGPSLTRRQIRVDCELRVKFNLASNNRKTGPIPVSMTSPNTCPPVCPWLNNGCYAEQHFMALHWRRLSTNPASGMSWDRFISMVEKLPPGQLWRHNEAGDLPGDGNAIDGDKLFALTLASQGKRGFTYTHKPMLDNPANRIIVNTCNTFGFTINLSADDLDEADQLTALGIAPVVVVLPERSPPKVKTPAGRHVVVCPALGASKLSCSTCKLCALHNRKSIIGFPAHGDMRKRMSTSLTQLRLF